MNSMYSDATTRSIESIPEFSGRLLFNEPMSAHTSFAIGGPADIFALPNDMDSLLCLLRWARSESIPVTVVGSGTNLLVSDKGIRGLVIGFGRGFGGVRIRSNQVVAGAGARLSRVLRRALSHGLTGLEGLFGVPGSVGGAVCMNAGTPSGCVADVLESVTVADLEGRLAVLPACELGFGYRRSDIAHRGLIVTEAVFALKPESTERMNEIIRALMVKRKESQPYGVKTAGSMFKNPNGGYAGELLEAVGAKGMQEGDARVSSKHANFIVNTGSAKAADVWRLMTTLRDRVREKFGIDLEPEVTLVGEW